MSLLKHKRSIDDIWPINNKTFLIRVDFNIPIRNGTLSRSGGGDARILAALPTVRRVIEGGGKAVLFSHMGRPTGHKHSILQTTPEQHRHYLQIWKSERGKGLTTYFSLLSGEDKKRILNWSSVAGEAWKLSDVAGAGKTDLFASLGMEEKVVLLERFRMEEKKSGEAVEESSTSSCNNNDDNDDDEETQFPQLRQYDGFQEELTLEPVATRLSQLLNADPSSSSPIVVKFAPDCMNAKEIVQSLTPGQVLLLENVRFYSDDNSKDESERRAMAERLASYGDYFVSDAFGTSHRTSATVVGIPSVMGHGCCGYSMKREIEAYADLLGEPPRPIVAVVGGVKVSEKILWIESILPQMDYIVVGGAVAFTFLKSRGFTIGRSFHEAGQSFSDRYEEVENIDEMAERLLVKAKACNVRVLLPLDHICHTACCATDSPLVTENANIPDGYIALDIGPKTAEQYQNCIASCRTAVWSGPMGVYEMPSYSNGTFVIAKAMGDGTQERGLVSIIGGGASATAARVCGHEGRVSHISSGGGASLDLLLEGKNLPGISVLDDL
ncbi:hypothetical protein HJC23_000491 [Cyclotella cryptica]|uniref:Phosphoglycerate kinase n=1 Tax=Cyclotella cryptica TaxID=29204 RepID=A0ABD3Q9Y2_9STRA